MAKTPVSILIIDGDAASRNYLAAMLGKEGFTILTAGLGREGLISAWRDHPDIIILDPVLPDLPGLELVNRLRQDSRTSKLPCVALSSQEDQKEMVAFLAAGCNEYLTKSSQSVSRILELIPRLIKGEVTTPAKRGLLMAFLSAKGGAGTSSLCTNIAMCLGSEKIETRVAVIDLVLPIGSISDIVGINDQLNLVSASDMATEEITSSFFVENLPRVPGWYFYLLSGATDPSSANRLAVERIEKVINAIIESHDYIFIDIGRTLSRISLPVLKNADAVVIIIGTDLASAVLTKKVWNYLQNQGIDQQHTYVLQNRSIGLEGLTKTELEQMTGLPIQLTIPYMSGNFSVSNNRHESVINKFPNDSATLTLKQAASQIVELGQKSRHLRK
jgi:MinD-like ATPase involved in chromosome partitioning or flagellar assembly/ActR/RegA family two-component response regulator